jgi:hypothetical protein
VAEILNRLVPLARELDVNIRWEILEGGADFFEVNSGADSAGRSSQGVSQRADTSTVSSSSREAAPWTIPKAPR